MEETTMLLLMLLMGTHAAEHLARAAGLPARLPGCPPPPARFCAAGQAITR
jgi:hypothetical protein